MALLQQEDCGAMGNDNTSKGHRRVIYLIAEIRRRYRCETCSAVSLASLIGFEDHNDSDDSTQRRTRDHSYSHRTTFSWAFLLTVSLDDSDGRNRFVHTSANPHSISPGGSARRCRRLESNGAR